MSEQQVEFKAKDYKRDLGNANYLFTGEISSKGTVTEDTIRQQYQSMERARKEIFDKMQREAKAAVALGMPIEKVLVKLKLEKLSEADRGRLLYGTYQKYIPTKQLYQKIWQKNPKEAEARIQLMEELVNSTQD